MISGVDAGKFPEVVEPELAGAGVKTPEDAGGKLARAREASRALRLGRTGASVGENLIVYQVTTAEWAHNLKVVNLQRRDDPLPTQTEWRNYLECDESF